MSTPEDTDDQRPDERTPGKSSEHPSTGKPLRPDPRPDADGGPEGETRPPAADSQAP